MSQRKVILLIVALLIAVATGLLARGAMTKKAAAPVSAEAPQQTMDILVAAKDLPVGTLLRADDIKWQSWPKTDQTAGLLVKDKDSMESAVGAVVRQGMRTGEPLMTGRIVRKGDQGFMAAVLNPGMRAISVALTPVSGVAGFVFPGDHVDVIVTHEVGRKSDMDANTHKVAETLLRDVRVLALDQQSNDQTREPKVAKIATLEVSSKQAEEIAVAADMGMVSLALRSLEAGPDDVPLLTENQAAEPKKDSLPVPPVPESDFTWDSDVSRVIHGPNNRRGTVQRVQILRGKEKSETVFDINQ